MVQVELCKVTSDPRGDLIEFISSEDLREWNETFGQVYVVTMIEEGQVRGNHFHKHSSELFCLLRGSAEFLFKDIESDVVDRFTLTAIENSYFKVTVPRGTAHTIVSRSTDVLLLCFSTVSYNITSPDKHVYTLYP